MRLLMVVALVASSGCALHYSAHDGSREIGVSSSSSGPSGPPVVIISDGPSGLCSPDDPDPQHTCPAKAGPDQR
jgi:hypothetical protein